MKLIDGKEISLQVKTELKKRVRAFTERYQRQIGLAVVLIGDDAASKVYVKNKVKACEETGIRSIAHFLPPETTQEEAEAVLLELARDENVHGILLQLPVPKHLNSEALLSLIPKEKDVDGFLPENIGALALQREGAVACTPLGVMELLRRTGIEVSGKHAVVVGRSNIVGKPMALLLLNADATVTICHSKTRDLREECLRADILVAAVGKPKFITADMVKEGAVVIDVGINRDENGKLCGDVDDTVAEKASFMTPVPGGVGPMTIAMLLRNTVCAAERSTR